MASEENFKNSMEPIEGLGNLVLAKDVKALLYALCLADVEHIFAVCTKSYFIRLYRMIPAATDTLSDSFVPSMGISAI